jgi:hypothetical protein
MRSSLLNSLLICLTLSTLAGQSRAETAAEAFASNPLATTEYMVDELLKEFQRDCADGLIHCVYGPLGNDLAIELAAAGRDEAIAIGFGDFPIGGCQFLNEVPLGELYLHLMDHAYWHYYRNINYLRTSGYPDYVWRESVERLFSSQIEEAISVALGQSVNGDIYGPPPGMSRFVRDIALATFDYRHETGQMLPAPAIGHGSLSDRRNRGCGGDAFIFARLQPSPAGGQIRLMSMFSFEFCSRTTGSPFVNECGNWTYVGTSDVVDAGTYAVDVRWPDGARACFTNRSLDDDRAFDAPESTLTYVIEYDPRAHCG